MSVPCNIIARNQCIIRSGTNAPAGIAMHGKEKIMTADFILDRGKANNYIAKWQYK